MIISDGTWHHVCTTWTSVSGQLRVYKDSEVVGRLKDYIDTLSSVPGK